MLLQKPYFLWKLIHLRILQSLLWIWTLLIYSSVIWSRLPSAVDVIMLLIKILILFIRIIRPRWPFLQSFRSQHRSMLQHLLLLIHLMKINQQINIPWTLFYKFHTGILRCGADSLIHIHRISWCPSGNLLYFTHSNLKVVQRLGFQRWQGTSSP